MASSLAATLKERFDVDTELIEGGNGIFDVVVDGRLVFSKKETGRFPENQEIVTLLEA